MKVSQNVTFILLLKQKNLNQVVIVAQMCMSSLSKNVYVWSHVTHFGNMTPADQIKDITYTRNMQHANIHFLGV